MIKTEELYRELRKYPQRIPDFGSNYLQAVMSYSESICYELGREFKSKLHWLPSSEKWKPADQWLHWYDKEIQPLIDSKKYTHYWDIDIHYNGGYDDITYFKFHVWAFENQEFDPLKKPVFSGNTPKVADYLRENKGSYIVTDAFDLSFQDIKESIERERDFIEMLKSNIEKEPVQDAAVNNTHAIINIAIKTLRKKNKDAAARFMEKYSLVKTKHPEFNPSDFVKEINWAEPSTVTQKDWMEKFDEAEKMLSNSV